MIHANNSHNRHLANIFAKAGGDLPVVKIRTDLTEPEAFEIEIAIIKAIGRECHGGPLVNMTDGGEGTAGVPVAFTAERRAKISAANAGNKSRVGKHHSDATKETLREKSKGNKNASGRKRSEESRQRIRIARAKQSPRSAEGNMKSSNAMKARFKVHAPHFLGGNHTADTKAIITGHSRAYCARKRWQAESPVFPSDHATWGDGSSAGMLA